MMIKPTKPTPDYPLFPHASGQWAKKAGGKTHYFGPWSDPQAALEKYLAWRDGTPKPPKQLRVAEEGKPDKPYPDFPLYPHNSGQWAKQIRNRTHYFGPWSNPQAALDKYLAQRDALLAGKTPETNGDGLTIKELVNRFLNSKQLKVNVGELEQRTWDDYKTVTDRMITHFGAAHVVSSLTSSDFERFRVALAKTRGPVSLGNDITRARVVFKYAFDKELIDRPVRYGGSFSKPSRSVVRRARQEKGLRLFTPKQIRAMIGAASKPLKAMILLGVNCGFGNADCATLPMSKVDLRRGWIDFGRGKTGVFRKCRLWPETVKALEAVVIDRPRNAKLVFITSKGNTWERKNNSDPISKETAKLLTDLKIKRPGLTFYAIRHTFQTIGEESGDRDATRFIMGHIPSADDMSAVYRERMAAKRLHAVALYVRRWVFKQRKGKSQSSPPVASASAVES